MTEADWLACTDPQKMLEFLRGKVSERKLRLLALAFCDKIRHLFVDDRSIAAFKFLELHAEHGLRRRRGRKEIEGAAWKVSLNRMSAGQPGSFQAATAVALSLGLDPWEAVRQAVEVSIVALAGGPGPQEAQKRLNQLPILRDTLGNPFRSITLNPSWLTPTVTGLAESIYQERAFERLPILADALEDAGCSNADILNHCRQGEEHVRGCWVLDLLTGRE